MPDAPPTIVVLGGPNGAGKSTAAPFLIPEALGIAHYINADAIARGISPFAPESVAVLAGRVMLRRMNELAASRENFAFESTLAGRGMAQWLKKRIEEGYRIRLAFLWIANADLAVQRVATRVREGGHDIAEPVIRRRYANGVRNLHRVYLPIAADWQVYNNSGLEPTLVAAGGMSRLTTIAEAATWSLIRSGANA